ncbi:MAG: M28 family peptidase [Planctomycetota bacterium]|nr:M28 family peptidase [Planctomycetota bacterium]
MKATRNLFLILLPLAACTGPSLAVTAPELEGHVEWLADDAQEGRMTGSPGAYRSAEYLKDRLLLAGLQPGGTDGSWFQEFEVQMPPAAGNSKLTVNGKSVKGVSTVAASPNEEAAGVLVSAAYGVVNPAEDLDDFAALDVSGKVVLVRRYTEYGLEASEELKSLGNLRKKIRNASAAGAVGIILGTHPDDIARGGEEMTSFKAVEGAMPIPVITVNSETFASLEAQCGKDAEVLLAPEVVQETRIARNVIAAAPGTTDEWVVVGAHYDHLGFGGEGSLAPGSHEIHNGADDNASGTAMTLELAETWGVKLMDENAGQRGMLFCFWSGEEMGLLGSAHWVDQPTLDLRNVVGNLNLDMVGRLEAGTITVGSAGTAAAFAPALDYSQAIMDSGNVAMRWNVMAGEMAGGGGSDHMSFHKMDIPAIFFFSGIHSDYHKPSDTADKVTYAGMANLAVGLIAFLEHLETAPRSDFAYLKPAASKDAGKGRRGMADGIWFGSMPDYGAMVERGMLINGTSAGSPAEKAGLLAGDIIVKVGPSDIGDIYDFMDSLADFKNGQTITVVVLRDGKPTDLSLTFFPRPSGE